MSLMNMDRRILLVIAASFLSLPVLAAQPVAEEPGVSGFFLLGISGLSVESNTLATSLGGSVDLGGDAIDDLTQDPDSKSGVLPLIGLSVTYTFENKATELFFGSSLEDFLRFDFSTAIGLRHQVSEVGIFEVSALSTPVATEVWEDPYLTGAEHEETDRTAKGLRLEWGSIMGSDFDLGITSRGTDIDRERSGDSLVTDATITAVEQDLLDRNGDINVVSVTYNWKYEKGQSFSIQGNSIEYDLDGEAMSYNGYSVQLNHIALLAVDKRLVSNFLYGSFEYDEENPVFDKKDEKDLLGFTVTLFLSDPFGFKGWLGNATVVYSEEDNDIDFYDTNASMISIGMLRKF